MKIVIKNRWALVTLAVIVVVSFIAVPLSSMMVVANIWFMIGLAFLIAGAFFIVEKGHLFTGWRRRKKKGEESLPDKKISVRDVASLKNGPIIVNRYAWFCLINAVGLIALGILLTL